MAPLVLYSPKTPDNNQVPFGKQRMKKEFQEQAGRLSWKVPPPPPVPTFGAWGSMALLTLTLSLSGTRGEAAVALRALELLRRSSPPSTFTSVTCTKLVSPKAKTCLLHNSPVYVSTCFSR